MRPTKLTQPLLEAFQAVLADELAAIAFTEEELVWLANQRLPEHERITYRTFQRYKAEVLNETQDANNETQDIRHKNCHTERSRSTQDFSVVNEGKNEGESSLNRSKGERDLDAKLALCMHDTLKGALLTQKKALVRGVMEGQANWRRYTWMLERKFPDFRLKAATKSMVDNLPRPLATGPWPMENDSTQSNSARGKAGGQSTLAKGEAGNNQSTNQPTPKPEPTELEVITEKWRRKASGNPWSQGPDFYNFHKTPEEVRDLEEQMAEDVAKGYVNPCGHLGYQPATCPPDVDHNDYENGWYTFYTMGTKKGLRLPIRLWTRKQITRPPKEPMKELLWAEQEWERQHPGEPYPGETMPIDAWHEYPWPEKLPRPDPDEPERPYDPDRSVAHIRGRILGFSNGG